MNFKTNCVKTILVALLGLFILIGGVVQIQAQEIKAQSLTLQELLTGLKSTSSGASMEVKIQYITKRVKEIGVDFVLTERIEKRLLEAGATDSLIQEIRLQAPKAKAFSPAARLKAQKRREERDQAIKDYTKAIELNPKDEDSYSKRALLYYYSADYQLAMEDYVKVLQINPDDQTAKFRLDRILENIGEFFIFPARRSRRSEYDSDSGAIVKGFISTGNVRRREMMLPTPFYSNRGNDLGSYSRKKRVNILVFLNKEGRVDSAIALNGSAFSETRAALSAAKSSSFLEVKPSDQPTNDWVIIVYEFEDR